MVKDLTQLLAEQDQWKARNNKLTKAKRFDLVDFNEDKLFSISENLKIYHSDRINPENTKDPKVTYLFQFIPLILLVTFDVSSHHYQ